MAGGSAPPSGEPGGIPHDAKANNFCKVCLAKAFYQLQKEVLFNIFHDEPVQCQQYLVIICPLCFVECGSLDRCTHNSCVLRIQMGVFVAPSEPTDIDTIRCF